MTTTRQAPEGDEQGLGGRPRSVLPATAADRLIRARNAGAGIGWREVLPADVDAAYAVQDATVARLGSVRAWKVGAKGRQITPICAPLPATGVLGSGATLAGPPWLLRGVEVELALRVGRDLDAADALLGPEALAAAFDAVLPAVEVVETRLADWRTAAPLALLADLQSHGALVLGEPMAMPPLRPDLLTLQATLEFDGRTVAETCGGNPAQDVWRLLGWLIGHCAQRGAPLRAGQFVTTGSCTGMLFAPQGTLVQARLTGFGGVMLRF
jgi:2-keto-4-pentenoate hydratase